MHEKRTTQRQMKTHDECGGLDTSRVAAACRRVVSSEARLPNRAAPNLPFIVGFAPDLVWARIDDYLTLSEVPARTTLTANAICRKPRSQRRSAAGSPGSK